MKTRIADEVDIALGCLPAGEPRSAVLPDFPAEEAELSYPWRQPLPASLFALWRCLKQKTSWPTGTYFWLRQHHSRPSRLHQFTSPIWRLDERFLSKAFVGFNVPRQAVITGGLVLFLLIVTLMLALLSGMVAGTVVVADESLPGSSLYTLKLTPA